MSLILHRATRADVLADGLAELLSEPLADPFAQELVLVPAKGVERWLSQRLSHRLGRAEGQQDGVCAGVLLRNPASLVAELLGTREDDPWAPDALVWPLLRVIDAVMQEPWARVLAQHLGQGETDPAEAELRRGRRFAVALRLAHLFASYAEQRPALLRDWEGGGSGDGGGEAGGVLEPDLAWQPELWRALVREVARPSPVVRHGEVVRGLRAGTLEVDLPPRLSFFGHTQLSRSEAELMAALGEGRDVHVWLPHPSDALWRSLAGAEPAVWRRDDRSHLSIEHPLLAAMGRDLRETQGLFESVGGVDDGVVDSVQAPATTVLAHVQDQIRQAVAPTPSGLVDDSIRVHACHGAARQVEVLREVVLGLLADDETLEPRDILVMCPDIEAYAPLITGAFGLGEAVAGSHPGQRLRVMLADRSPSQTNPLLGVLSKLLDLADGRAEATRVLDLLASDPVRRRFGFSQDHLETITGWVTRSGVRWAWDAQGRSRFGLEAFGHNTWRAGLDRLLTGVAMSEDSRAWLGTTLPFDDVSTTEVGLAGRLAEAIDRLGHLTAQLSGAHPLDHWLGVLREGVDQIASAAPGEEWQRAQLERELSSFASAAGTRTAAGSGTGTGSGEVTLRLADVRSLLHARLAGRPTRAGFRTGTLTVCTMTPMRSVPHRVVCLLGVDDGVFPRGGTADGDDVLARVPMVGERDVRSQDRQLFLDAVMAAEERLVVTYTGFHEATGHRRPPAVPLRELLDVVAVSTQEEVERQHRSQAFHPDYLSGAPPFSFDPEGAAAARAASRVDRPSRPVLAELDLPPVAEHDVELADLLRAVVSPTGTFLRRRLGIDLPREEDEVLDAIPIDLRGLESWQVGQRILDDLLRGRPPDDVLQSEWRRGSLPPGRYGWHRAKELVRLAGPLVESFESSTQGVAARVHDVSVDLGGGRRLVGSVGGVHDQRLVRVGFSKLGAKQRLETWVSLVVLCAALPRPWVARAIGRAAQGAAPARATYSAPEDPAAVLRDLVALHDLALTRPLALTPATGRLWAQGRTSSRPAWMLEKDLADEFRSEARHSVELAIAWGRTPTWAEVTADPAPHLLGREAERLWAPILAAEAE